MSDNEKIGFWDAKFDEIMGGRSKLSDEFMEEKDRTMCLEVFKEYDEVDSEKY